jgi:hypothetical protein
MRDRDRLEGLFQTEEVSHQSRVDRRGAIPDIRSTRRLEDECYNGMSSRTLTSCPGCDPRVWLIPTGGSTLMLEIRTSSSSRTILTVRDGPSSARLVHACPLAGTNCLGSSQMGPGRHTQHSAPHSVGPAGLASLAVESGCEWKEGPGAYKSVSERNIAFRKLCISAAARRPATRQARGTARSHASRAGAGWSWWRRDQGKPVADALVRSSSLPVCYKPRPPHCMLTNVQRPGSDRWPLVTILSYSFADSITLGNHSDHHATGSNLGTIVALR